MMSTWMNDLGCSYPLDHSLLVVQYTKIFLVEANRYLQASEIEERFHDNWSGVCARSNDLDRDCLFINVPGMSAVVASIIDEYESVNIPVPTMEIVCFTRGKRIIRRELIDRELFDHHAVRLAFAGMRFSCL